MILKIYKVQAEAVQAEAKIVVQGKKKVPQQQITVAHLKKTRSSVLKKNAYGAKQTGVAKNVLQEKKQNPNQK